MTYNPYADKIYRRLERGAVILGDDSSWQDSPGPDVPRWRIDARWIEFDCKDKNGIVQGRGCRAERCLRLNNPKNWDPIIFRDLPEQAVYDNVCDFHAPSMNKIIGAGGVYHSFVEWKLARRPKLVRN